MKKVQLMVKNREGEIACVCCVREYYTSMSSSPPSGDHIQHKAQTLHSRLIVKYE